MKYLRPASIENSEPLFNEAIIYIQKLCSSIAKYIAIKSYEETINIMPITAKMIKITYSKQFRFSNFPYSKLNKIVMIAETNTTLFMTIVKLSKINKLLNPIAPSTGFFTLSTNAKNKI